MSASLKTRTLAKSANFSQSNRNKSSTLRSQAQSILNSSTLENIEIEYIKNLQQQVYFLEMECNYLRQQLNLNGLQTSLKYDSKSQELKTEMQTIQREKANLEKSLNEENIKNETVMGMLEQTEKSFFKEKELLLKEIAALKKQKKEAEEGFLNKSVELTVVKENLNKHHLDAHDSNHHLSKIEIQLEKSIKDNLHLRNELNDARHQLITRDNLIKDLQQQLADPNFRKTTANELKSSLNNVSSKLSLTSETLSKEIETNKHLKDESSRLNREVENFKHKIIELNNENTRLSRLLENSLKQNEADLIMAKKNADLAKVNHEKIQNELANEQKIIENLKNQIDQFKLQERLETKNHLLLKQRIKELEDSLSKHESSKEQALKIIHFELRSAQHQYEQDKNRWTHDHNNLLSINTNLESKINELNDHIDKQNVNSKASLESSKLRANQLQSQFDETKLFLDIERNNHKSLLLKIENFERQESIHTNLIDSLKSRIQELEHQEKNNSSELRQSHSRIAELEHANRVLRSEIDELSLKLKEIDRLKQLEDLIQSQKWGELNQLADSVKNLSRSMASSTLRDTNTF